MKKDSADQFKQFTDEQTHEQAAQIERNWRKKNKQQRNRIAFRILIAATIVIGLIFAIAFNVFIDRKYNHAILDSQDGYTYVQTNFPLLKVLIDDQFTTYETKMVKGLGMVFGQLVAWLGGNVIPDWKVLLVPNELSGTGMLAVALGNALGRLQGGRLDIMSKSEVYRKMVLKNVELMKKDNPNGFPVSIISGLGDIGEAYDLLVIENNDFSTSYSLDRFQRVVEVRKTKWNSAVVGGYFANQFNYEIAKGKTTEELINMGELYGYSVIPLSSSDKDEYKTVIYTKTRDPAINLCPEAQNAFKGASELRNLVEFMRNKEVVKYSVFYGLDSVEVLQMLLSFSVGKIYSDRKFGSEFDGKVKDAATFSAVSPSKGNYFIVNASTAATITTLPLGTTIVYVKSLSQFSEVTNKFSQNSKIWQLSPINNNGCFYPPRLFPAGESSFTRPSFLVIRQPKS